jgi:hypothetical protein
MTIEEYIAQLTDKERIAYETALKSLGSSFDVSKSNGYLKKKNIPAP